MQLTATHLSSLLRPVPILGNGVFVRVLLIIGLIA